VSRSRDEISRLIFSYAERLDLGDFAAVGSLFEHASYGAAEGPPLRGSAAVEKAIHDLVKLYDDGTPRTKHVTTNLVIEIDEQAGTASARSYFSVLQSVEDKPIQPIVAGRYHDRFKRAARGWRFTERRIYMDLLGDLSGHLRSPPGRSRRESRS
jgi:3-phenylpropionate/cinnamic acid dioxygenase small subunit